LRDAQPGLLCEVGHVNAEAAVAPGLCDDETVEVGEDGGEGRA
jgi:hypothetical protein